MEQHSPSYEPEDVERIIAENHERLVDSFVRGEAEIDSGEPLLTLEEFVEDL